jgi:hypothetical protein
MSIRDASMAFARLQKQVPIWGKHIDGQDLIGRHTHTRTLKLVEEMAVEDRLKQEKRYQADPKKTHNDLVYRGYWLIAAQLKIDYEAGRLR